MIKFTVPGRPTPYTRMTQRSKWNERSKKYLEYKHYVRIFARQAMSKGRYAIFPKGRPLELGCRVYLKGGLDGDLSNYIKGIEDACNKLIYEDDRWIYRYIYADKIMVSTKQEERVEVEIRRMKPEAHEGA